MVFESFTFLELKKVLLLRIFFLKIKKGLKACIIFDNMVKEDGGGDAVRAGGNHSFCSPNQMERTRAQCRAR